MEALITFIVVAITIKDSKDKYGRYLVAIYLPDSELSVNQRLLNAGLAVPYNP